MLRTSDDSGTCMISLSRSMAGMRDPNRLKDDWRMTAEDT